MRSDETPQLTRLPLATSFVAVSSFEPVLRNLFGSSLLPARRRSSASADEPMPWQVGATIPPASHGAVTRRPPRSGRDPRRHRGRDTHPVGARGLLDLGVVKLCVLAVCGSPDVQSAEPRSGLELGMVRLAGRMQRGLVLFRTITGLTAVTSPVTPLVGSGQPSALSPPVHPRCARRLRSLRTAPCREQWFIHVRSGRRSPSVHSHTCPIGLRCSCVPFRLTAISLVQRSWSWARRHPNALSRRQAVS